jgi:uncharacterized protein (DUF1800 family)
MIPDRGFPRLPALGWVILLCGVVQAQSLQPGPATKPSAEEQAKLDRQIAIHVLNRCTFGPRPRDVERIVEKGWKSWVAEQLEPEKIDDSALEKVIAEKYPSLRMGLGEVMGKYYPSYDKMMLSDQEAQRKRNELRQKIRRETRESVLVRAIESERMLNEVVVEFWRNHFNVDINKDDVVYLGTNYEEQVIRRFAFGRFEDMLMASAHHPAMLIYLDNVISQRPLTPEEEKRIERANNSNRYKPRSVVALERHRGLNENYARELLELHTLGADNYYRQYDVTEVARVLTGWSVNRKRDDDYGFYFRKDYHDRLPKEMPGIGYFTKGRGGYEDGVDLLRHLARHRGTGQFIAWKLCRYFVNDEPPVALVKKVARTFQMSGGDLRKVYREILLSPEFADPQNFKAKFKTPFEFTVSAIRVTGAEVSDYRPTLEKLKRMGQAVYECEDPTGYYDQAEAWCDPGVMVHRWSYAMRLAEGHMQGVKLPDNYFNKLASVEPKEAKRLLVKNILPLGIDEQTSAALDRAAEKSLGGGEWVAKRLLGLLLGSPAFQQQ